MPEQKPAHDPHIMIAITPAGIEQVTCISGDADENARMLAALLDGGSRFSLAMPAAEKGSVVTI